MSMIALRSKVSYLAFSDRAFRALLAVRQAGPPAPPKPRLFDRVREAIRARHYSRRTEKTYVAWIRRYILFHGKRHPVEMGPGEITQFLSALAVKDKVAASTQNQALSALLFLYRAVLEQDVPSEPCRPDPLSVRASMLAGVRHQDRLRRGAAVQHGVAFRTRSHRRLVYQIFAVMSRTRPSRDGLTGALRVSRYAGLSTYSWADDRAG